MNTCCVFLFLEVAELLVDLIDLEDYLVHIADDASGLGRVEVLNLDLLLSLSSVVSATFSWRLRPAISGLQDLLVTRAQLKALHAFQIYF